MAAQFQLVVLAGIALTMTVTGIVVTRLAGRTPYVLAERTADTRSGEESPPGGAVGHGGHVPDAAGPHRLAAHPGPSGATPAPASTTGTRATGPGPRATWSAR